MTPNWLVRTHQNRIFGPMSQDELSRKVLAGEFSTQDEICRGTGYWISLHEKDEVRRHLGVEVPLQPKRTRKTDDDVTETETATATQTQTQTETETLTATEIPTEARHAPAVSAAPLGVPNTYRVEQPSVLKGMVLFLVIALGLILAQVFKLTRPSPDRADPPVHEAIGESLTIPSEATSSP